MNKEVLALVFECVILFFSIVFFFITMSENIGVNAKRFKLAVTALGAAGIIFKLGKEVGWTILFFGIILLTQIENNHKKKCKANGMDNKKLGGNS